MPVLGLPKNVLVRMPCYFGFTKGNYNIELRAVPQQRKNTPARVQKPLAATIIFGNNVFRKSGTTQISRRCCAEPFKCKIKAMQTFDRELYQCL